jgi:transcriptional regulator with XRE-family HTH domain
MTKHELDGFLKEISDYYKRTTEPLSVIIKPYKEMQQHLQDILKDISQPSESVTFSLDTVTPLMVIDDVSTCADNEDFSAEQKSTINSWIKKINCISNKWDTNTKIAVASLLINVFSMIFNSGVTINYNVNMYNLIKETDMLSKEVNVMGKCKIPVLFDVLEQRGIKNSQFAAAIDVSTGNVSDWKSGRSSPKPDTLVRIADFLGVSTDYLLGRNTTPKYEFAFNSKLDELSDEQLQLVSDYIEFIKSQNKK